MGGTTGCEAGVPPAGKDGTGHVKKSYRKLIIREVTHSLSRFLAIFGIVALGVGFLAGLLATTPDMRVSVDRYYDETRMFDIRVVSTLGLTEADAAAIRNTGGVKGVMPSRTADALVRIPQGDDLVARIQSLPLALLQEDSPGYQNRVSLLEGRMPAGPGECVLDVSKIADQGVEVGDVLTLSPDNADLSDTLALSAFTVVGKVESATYFSIEREPSTVGNGTVSLIFYTGDDAFSLDVYTDLYILVDGADAQTAFTDGYEDAVRPVMDTLERLGIERSAIRLGEVKEEAQRELDDARTAYEDKKAEAEAELADAQRQLDDARAEIADAERELAENRRALEEGEAQLEDGRRDYAQGLDEYNEGLASWQDGVHGLEAQRTEYQAAMAGNEQELEDGKTALAAAREALADTKRTLDESRATLDAARQRIEESLAAGLLSPEQAETELAKLAPQEEAYAQGVAGYEAGVKLADRQERELLAAEKALAAGKQAALAEFAAAQAQLDSVKTELDSAKAAFDKAARDIAESEVRLADGRRQLEDGEAALEEARAQLEQGEADYEQGRRDADEQLEDAKRQLDDAQRDIDGLGEPEWMVLDRSSNAGYVSFEGNAEKVAAIAQVFPIFFFLVAALVALTTMTRMVEEERTQIGTLKALGYSRGAIMVKYLLYAGAATVCGCVFGLLVGFRVFPTVIWCAYEIMYDLPPLVASFNVKYAALSSSAAILCTMLATLSACAGTLRENPARLMLPKAPKAGKRVFLERIPLIWNHLTFTHKVTARNLIRYKKRFFMTVIGIAGCTALLLTGFGLRDSISDIVDKQFGEIAHYNLMAGLKTDRDDDGLAETLASSASESLYVQQTNVDATGSGGTLSAYLYVPEEAARLGDFITLRERKSGKAVPFSEDSVLLTEKLAAKLGVGAGDPLTLRDGDGRTAQVTVGGVTENYVYNYIYMAPSLYRSSFGAEPDYNLVTAKVADESDANQDAVATALLGVDGVTSVSFTTDVSRSFADIVKNIDYIVIVLIVSAGLLAFVVLYNLTNINITERQKEIATIKVLGFYDREVNAYIFRETGILSIIGTGVGLILGIFLHAFVVRTAEVEIVMFGRDIYAMSFLLAAALTLAFSALVDVVMARKLRRIDMVESMKAGE